MIKLAKYGPKAQEEIHKQLHEHKHEGKWQSRKQAIAVGISEAREKGSKFLQEKNNIKLKDRQVSFFFSGYGSFDCQRDSSAK